jgi:hypothetical protein
MLSSRYLAECCGGMLTPQADHHQTTILQEFIKLNTPVFDAIIRMSSDSACLSDAARISNFFQIILQFSIYSSPSKHFAQLNRDEIRRISDMPSQDLATLQALAPKRVGDGLQDVLCLALLLDPRPSMQAFVKRTGLLGTAADLSLGATDCVAAAVQAIKATADGITIAHKSSAEVGMALSKALQLLLGFCTIEDRAAHCTVNKCIAAMQMQACALCSMLDGLGPGISHCAMLAEILTAGSRAGAP